MSDAGYIRRSKRVVYENAWLSFEAHDIVHPTGAPGVHGVVVTPRASAVVLADGNDVLLVRQPRFAVDRVVLEVIKGGRHDGEDGLACAQRESREEAGMLANRWVALGETYEIPSIVQEPVSLYLGIGLTPAALAPEDVERIDVVRMRFDDALDACAAGGIEDAVTAVALLRARPFLKGER
ncbi:MAG: mismatch repair protein MutT [Candidatus Eremiobacteraeota bacterium]|nr:mismatch repair protein MutT [Candidatus Eremiobacteraeota bacterium]